MNNASSRLRYHAEYLPDGTPLSIELVPTTMGRILLDYESDQGVLSNFLAERFIDVIKIIVRRYRPQITNEQLQFIKGVIIGEDSNTGRAAVHHPGRHVGTPNVYLRDINGSIFRDLIEQIHQSNMDIEFRDIKWIYKFDLNSVRYGAGVKKIIKQSWAPVRDFKEVWENHVDQYGDINCAAFAICYLNACTRDRKNTKRIIQHARELMFKLKWPAEISISDLESYVKTYTSSKMLILQEGEREALEFTGNNYIPLRKENGEIDYKNDANIIHLIYLGDQKHFVTYNSFFAMIKNKKCWFYNHFCYACNYCVNIEDRANCRCRRTEDEVGQDSSKRQKTMRRLKNKCGCGEYGCIAKECKITCQHCKGSHKRAHMYTHRCIVVGPEKGRVFWKEGDDETGADLKTMLWAYDIESSMIVVEGETTKVFRLNYTQDGFERNEDHTYIMDEVKRTKHLPTLVVARNVFKSFDTDAVIFKGDDALKDFVKFMNTTNGGNNICFAHNAQGYDSRLISTMCRENYNDADVQEVSCLARGNKFLEISVLKARFRDSMCFLVGGLASLAKSYFPNDNVRKGDFPHQFNIPENYDYIGDVPSKDMYGRQFGNKTAKDANEFDVWYAQECIDKKGIWDFNNELLAYCKNDVMVLAKLMREFHDIAAQKNDPNEQIASPWQSVTAPSWVHKTIKRKIYPTLELESFTKKSDEYMEHVQLLADKETWAVLVENEYWFARLALRGGRTEVRRIYYKLSEEDKRLGKSIRYQDIVSMYPYVQVAFDYPVGTPVIEIYDKAFFPCYTHKAPPSGNVWDKTCTCSLAIRRDRLDARLKIEERYYQPSTEDIINDDKFFGVVCASLTPPNNLFHPVLVHYDEKLNKCVGSLKKIEKGVFTSVEFVKALKHGYRLDKIHRFDRYRKMPGLWNEFIKELYIDKMANAGPTPPVEEWTPLIRAYEDGFEMGSMIKSSLEKGWGDNPSKKQTAKISINSGWGKHCQRPNMPEVKYMPVDDLEKMLVFDKNLDEGTFNLKKWDFMGNQTRAVVEKNGANGRIDLHDSYLPAGIFVPAYGRMMLWDQLHKLGDRVLMHDTDSIVYIYDPTSDYNIPESNIWGGWEREGIDEKNGGIETYIGLGPKSYAIKAMNGKIVIKNKGVSIKHAHRDIVSFENLEKMVLAHMNDQPIIPLQVPQMRFLWTLQTAMTTQEYLKKLTFTPENLKGKLDKQTGILYPFGWME